MLAQLKVYSEADVMPYISFDARGLYHMTSDVHIFLLRALFRKWYWQGASQMLESAPKRRTIRICRGSSITEVLLAFPSNCPYCLVQRVK